MADPERKFSPRQEGSEVSSLLAVASFQFLGCSGFSFKTFSRFVSAVEYKYWAAQLICRCGVGLQ